MQWDQDSGAETATPRSILAMKNPAQIFNVALAALNKGDLPAAEDGFRKVLKTDKAHVPALNLMTIVLMSLRRFAEAEPFIARAVALNKNSDVSFYNYGLILKELNRPQQALAQFGEALTLNPKVPETWNNRGTVYNALKDYTAAIADFDRALTLNPLYGEAYFNKGKSLAELRRYDEALTAFDKALSTRPDLAEAWLGRGNVLIDLTRFDVALGAFDKALSLQPALAAAWLGRGNALVGLKRYDEALAAFDKALALQGDTADAWLGRGNALTELKRYDEAFGAYDRALTLNPALAGAWLGRGNVLADLKRYDEACAAFDKAIALDPDLADAYVGKAMARLTVGDFAVGWDLYEWRYKTAEFHALAQELKGLNLKARPTRQDLAGKSVAVLAEQGIGDEIMFAGIVPELARDARSVAYECDPRLTGLFERSFPTVRFFKRDDRRTTLEKPADIVLKAGSLPYAYRRVAGAFPKAAYLTPDPQRVAHWTDWLHKSAGTHLKVGLSWRGGTSRTRTNDRSLELDRLKRLTGLPDTYFVSLQYGDVVDEIVRFNDLHPGGRIHHPLDDINNFDELAALIASLDLVVSVQNTTIHLCGALGKPCWGMIAWRPEWRYGAAGETMAWYPSVQLYRQQAIAEWTSVLDTIQGDLERITGERRRA